MSMVDYSSKPRPKEKEKTAESNIFEGIVSLRAVLSAENGRTVERVLYACERLEKNRREYAWICGEAERKGFSVELLPRAEIDEIALGTSHGGILAYCSGRVLPRLDSDFIEKNRKNGFFVMIEGIEDPFNFGYALRSVYAAGADGVILSERNWMSAAGVVCRSSAGASEKLPLAVAEPCAAAQSFADAGFRVVCADIPDSVSVYEADLSFPLLIVVGGEKRGISRSLLSCADTVVRLEYGRDFPEALSAASAVSILSFEVLRRNLKK